MLIIVCTNNITTKGSLVPDFQYIHEWIHDNKIRLILKVNTYKSTGKNDAYKILNEINANTQWYKYAIVERNNAYPFKSGEAYVRRWTMLPWASYQIRIIAGAHAPGMPGTFSPPPRVSDPDMHHGTCVTHVPWCMPGSLTSSFLWSRWRGKTFPAFPAHAQPAILRIWQEAHGLRRCLVSRTGPNQYLNQGWLSVYKISEINFQTVTW